MNPLRTGNDPSPEVFNPQNRCHIGEGVSGRIGFESAELRNQFFAEVRAALQLSSWEKFAESFGLRRNYFQNYQYGKLLMPESLFEAMLSKLPSDKHRVFLTGIFSKPYNWGAVKGGKVLYKKYPEEIRQRLRSSLKNYHAPRPIKEAQCLSLELCEFVGAFIGDGYIDRQKTLGISGDSLLDNSYHHYLARNGETLFGIMPRFYISKVKRGIYTKFNSQNLVKLFNERFGFPLGDKTCAVRIPQEILSADEAFLFRTVRGIFDTDGCVFFDKRKAYTKPYPRITLEIKSRNLAEQLVQILGRHFSVRHKFGTKRGSCIVEIYGHSQLEKWMSLIGFSNERHLDRIKAGSGNCTRDLSIIVSPSLIKDTYQSTAPLIELSRQKLS